MSSFLPEELWDIIGLYSDTSTYNNLIFLGSSTDLQIPFSHESLAKKNLRQLPKNNLNKLASAYAKAIELSLKYFPDKRIDLVRLTGKILSHPNLDEIQLKNLVEHYMNNAATFSNIDRVRINELPSCIYVGSSMEILTISETTFEKFFALLETDSVMAKQIFQKAYEEMMRENLDMFHDVFITEYESTFENYLEKALG